MGRVSGVAHGPLPLAMVGLRWPSATPLSPPTQVLLRVRPPPRLPSWAGVALWRSGLPAPRLIGGADLYAGLQVSGAGRASRQNTNRKE